MLPGGRPLNEAPKGKAYLILALLAGGPVLLLCGALFSPSLRGTLRRSFLGRESAQPRTFLTRAEDAPVPKELLQPPAEAPRPSPESLISGSPSSLAGSVPEDGVVGALGARSRRSRSSSRAGGDPSDSIGSTGSGEEGPVDAETAEERVKARAEKIAADMVSKVTGGAGAGSRKGLASDSFGGRRSSPSQGRFGAAGSQGRAENAAQTPFAEGLARTPSVAAGGSENSPGGGFRGALASISRVSRKSSSGGGGQASGPLVTGTAPPGGGEGSESKTAPGGAESAFDPQKAAMKSAEGLMAEAKEANARAEACRGVVDENTPAINRLTKEQGDLSTRYANQCRSGLVNCLGHYPYGFDCRSMDPDECDKWSTCRRPKAGSEWEMEDYPCCVQYHWDFLGCWHNWGGQRQLNSGCWNRQKGYVCPCSTLRCGIEQKCRGINSRNCEISKGCGDACKPVSCTTQ